MGTEAWSDPLGTGPFLQLNPDPLQAPWEVHGLGELVSGRTPSREREPLVPTGASPVLSALTILRGSIWRGRELEQNYIGVRLGVVLHHLLAGHLEHIP